MIILHHFLSFLFLVNYNSPLLIINRVNLPCTQKKRVNLPRLQVKLRTNTTHIIFLYFLVQHNPHYLVDHSWTWVCVTSNNSDPWVKNFEPYIFISLCCLYFYTPLFMVLVTKFLNIWLYSPSMNFNNITSEMLIYQSAAKLAIFPWGGQTLLEKF
jgi:hypothetical protein